MIKEKFSASKQEIIKLCIGGVFWPSQNWTLREPQWWSTSCPGKPNLKTKKISYEWDFLPQQGIVQVYEWWWFHCWSSLPVKLNSEREKLGSFAVIQLHHLCFWICSWFHAICYHIGKKTIAMVVLSKSIRSDGLIFSTKNILS